MQLTQATIIVLIAVRNCRKISYAICITYFLQFLNQQNHKILSSVKDQVETEMIEKVVLYKLKNDVYAQSMPYQEEYAFIEEWMRKYYELPDGVKWNGMGFSYSLVD